MTLLPLPVAAYSVSSTFTLLMLLMYAENSSAVMPFAATSFVSDSGYCFQSWSKQSCCLRCCFCGHSGTDRSGLLLCSGKHHFQGTFCGTETCIIFKRTAFSKKPDYIVTVVRSFCLAHLKQESYLIQLISIAISQNNAIKTVQQSAKDKENI